LKVVVCLLQSNRSNMATLTAVMSQGEEASKAVASVEDEYLLVL
jgi:hypothetical protein